MHKKKAVQYLLFAPILVALLCFPVACKKNPTNPNFKDLLGGGTSASGTATPTPTPGGGGGGGGSHTFVKAWGSEGVSVGQFENPNCIAVDESYNLYVSDYGNDRIQVFNSSGAAVTHWSCVKPYGLDVDNGFNVFVADLQNNLIHHFTQNGVHVEDYSTDNYSYDWNGMSSAPTPAPQVFTCTYTFTGPTGIAIDSNGNQYISNAEDTLGKCPEGWPNFYETLNYMNKSSKMSTEVWRSDFHDGSEFMAVALDNTNNFAYTIDGNKHCLIQVSTAPVVAYTYGTFVTIGTQGNGNYQFEYPHGVTVNRNTGHVYVADTYNHRIMEYDKTLTYVGQFGSYGTAPGQFKNPWGMASDRDGYIYVVDSGNHRIQKFAP